MTTVFVDVETTGLEPSFGAEVWEVAMIRRVGPVTERRLWQLPVDLGKADPMSLSICRFHDRRWDERPISAKLDGDYGREVVAVRERVLAGAVSACPFGLRVEDLPTWALTFARLTHGATWVGACPDFDATRFLGPLLRRNGACPGWYYHLVDVEHLAVGYLRGTGAENGRFHDHSWKSEDLSLAVAVDPTRFDRHSAMGDAEWAMAIYDRVMGTGE